MTLAGQPAVNYFDNPNRLTQIAQGSSTVSFSYDNQSANQRLGDCLAGCPERPLYLVKDMPEPIFKPNTIGQIIAERKFTILGALERGAGVKVLLGKPEKLPDGPDFYCPFQIVGMGSDKVRCAYGIDAFQAIQLAMTAIGAFLKSLSESEEIGLRWEGDESGELGFPLPQ
jgi:hypothetical protein